MKLVSIFLQRAQAIFEIYLKYIEKQAKKHETCFNFFTASAGYIRDLSQIY